MLLAALPLAAGALLVAGGSAAQAASCTATSASPVTAYPPAQCAGTVSATSVGAGGSLTVGGSGFTPGHTVTLTLFPGGVSLGTAVVDSDGNVSAAVTIPSGAEAGVHHIAIFDAAGSRLLTVQFTVVAESSSTLPRTGSDHLLSLSLAGLGLVVLGSGGLVIARRRRAREHQPA